MTLDDLMMHLTRVFFVLLAAITCLNYLRRRDPVRRDVALVSLCMSAGILISLFMQVTGINWQWLPRLGSLALIAQPFLLVRIVGYFRPVDRRMRWFAIGGMLASWLATLTVLNQRGALPTLVSVVIIIYFTLVDGYAIVAFIRGAFSSVGVVRQRLQFAAAGSALLVAALILIGIRTVFPETEVYTVAPTQFISILAGLAYYLSFAPPRWLQQVWQLAELRNFLASIQQPGDHTRYELLSRLVRAVSRSLSTDLVGVLLARENGGEDLWVKANVSAGALTELPQSGAVRQSWTQRTPQIVYRRYNASPVDAAFMTRLQVEMMLIVPLETTEHAFGLLVVCLENGSLFVDDDLQLLTVFVQQTAIVLENIAVLNALRSYADELEQRVQERTRELARSNEELRQFAFVASHDLKEPLRTITSYLQLIEARYTDQLDDDGREFIGFAVKGAARMKNLIEDLLVYSRVDRRERTITSVTVEAVLDEACQSLATSIQEAEATITHDHLPEIQADHRLLLQLLQNLLSNAIKYRGSHPPKIHIGVKQQPTEWVFCVQDNGIGIERQYLETIFVIFKRLHNQHEYSGTGIGLAVCKKAVEIHGGRIWAESEPGVGSTFYFTIPIAA